MIDDQRINRSGFTGNFIMVMQEFSVYTGSFQPAFICIIEAVDYNSQPLGGIFWLKRE
jgi:hypothetical protein